MEGERQFWLWVTRPEYYLEEDGSEREILDLNSDEGWWTCHRDTKRGDLIFLWRTMPKSDICYLIQAKSDAYSIVDENDQGWPYGCDYKVLFKFENPTNIKDLRNNAYLDEWKPFRGNFQRSVYRIEPEYWVRLNQLISSKNLDYGRFIEALQKEPVAESIKWEDELEEKLAQDFSPLKKFGYDLILYTDPNNPEISGRQLVCKGNGGRIDFLCYDKAKNRYVVVELKVVRAGQNTIGQILNYMGWVQNHITKNGLVEGLVISKGYDTRFESALKVTDRITQLDIDRLGFKLISSKDQEAFEHQSELENVKEPELEKEDSEKRQRLKEARLWQKKGNALFDQAKYEEAITCYDKVIENDPKDKWGLINKGAALAELDKYDRAIECYDKAIEVNPKSPWPWNNKGWALFNLERHDEAISCFDKAIEMKPKFGLAWNGKGVVLDKLGKYDEAIKNYDRAIGLSPKDAVFRRNKGFALICLGDKYEAILAFDKAIKLNPKDSGSYIGKGMILDDQGKYDAAIECYDKAIQIDPHDATPWTNKGIVYSNLGKYEKAIQAHDKALSLDPEDSNAWINKGDALFDLGKYDEATKIYDKVVELDPEFALAWNNKGASLHKLGKYDDAINSYDRAIELDPKFAWPWNEKGIALYDQGKHEEAIRAYVKAIELDPQLANAWNNKGEALKKLGRVDEAQVAFAKAKELGHSD